jgi:hypothetical protein
MPQADAHHFRITLQPHQPLQRRCVPYGPGRYHPYGKCATLRARWRPP